MQVQRLGKYLTLAEFCTCTQTYQRFADQIDPFPKNLDETLPALEALCQHIIDPAIATLADQLALDRPWREIGELEPRLRAIEDHYRARRTVYLARQEKKAEAIRQRLRQRQGFSQLTEQQQERVLRPVREAVYATSAEALFPTLLELKDSAVLKIHRAAEEANAYLDDILSSVTEDKVIPLTLNLSGREVSSPKDVERVVDELKQRMLDQLKDKPNVRIRLI